MRGGPPRRGLSMQLRSQLIASLSIAALALAATPTTLAVGGSLTPDATTMDFGSIPVTTSATRTMLLTNTGTGDVFVSGESVSLGYTLDSANDTCFAQTIAPGGTCLAAARFAPSALGAAPGTFQITTDSGNLVIYLSGTGTPNLVATQTSLDAGSVVVTGQTNVTTTLQNVGGVDIFVNGESATGSFFLSSLDTCFARTLAPGDTCTAAALFRPNAVGTLTGTLRITSDRGVPSPIELALTGVGTPNLVASAYSIDLGSAPISSSVDGTLTLQNVGTTNVFVNGESTTGDFFLSSLDNCFAHTLAPGDTCTAAARFIPSALGTRTGTLRITSDTGVPSPLTLSLTGRGTPNLVADVSSIDFGSVAAGTYSDVKTVRLSNLGSTSVALSSFTATAPFLIAANPCPANLAGGATCDLSLQFRPDALGTRLGSLHVDTTAAGGPVDVALSGVGTTSPALASLSATGFSFGSVGVGISSAPWTVLLTDDGPGGFMVNGVTLAGANPGDFAIVSDSCTGATLAQGGSCAVSLAFIPTAAGARTANVVFDHTASNAPLSAGLAGTGAAANAATSVSSLAFGRTRVGVTSSEQVVSLRNDGPGMLDVAAVTLGGSAPGDFAIASNGCAGVQLAPGASCAVSITFSPSATGARTASLTFVDDAVGGAQVVSLSGSGVGKRTP